MASEFLDNAALVAGDDDLPEGAQKSDFDDSPFVQGTGVPNVYVVG